VSFGVIGTLDASTAAGAINVNLGTGASAGVDASKMPWAINVTGSSFSDLIYGDARANVLIGGTGKDELHGMAGHDYVEGGIGDDKLFGEDGNDRLFGGDGKDALNGGAHNDEMHGGAGNDGFFGGGGNDTIYGDAGDDRIYGDGGDDVIHGGAGNDIMTGAGFNNGGARGANTYVWERADVVNADGSKAGLDHITDFGVGDRLDFSDIVAPSTAVQDAVRITDTAGGLVVAVDMGGTSGFVDVVVLDNVHGLTVEDLTHSGAIAV
jgi:Ca2+-binding RTX toxin-like protein